MNKHLSIKETYNLNKLWNINDSRSEATYTVPQKIGMMIALVNLHFTIVKDTGFINLISHLQPRYLLLSRRYFSETVIPRLYSTL